MQKTKGNEDLEGMIKELEPSEDTAGEMEREFFIRMTRKFGWSKNVLIHQIDNQTHEKSLQGQTNFDQALTPELHAQAEI